MRFSLAAPFRSAIHDPRTQRKGPAGQGPFPRLALPGRDLDLRSGLERLVLEVRVRVLEELELPRIPVELHGDLPERIALLDDVGLPTRRRLRSFLARLHDLARLAPRCGLRRSRRPRRRLGDAELLPGLHADAGVLLLDDGAQPSIAVVLLGETPVGVPLHDLVALRVLPRRRRADTGRRPGRICGGLRLGARDLRIRGRTGLAAPRGRRSKLRGPRAHAAGETGPSVLLR